ncbi:hypothetical protein [Metabacillus fastidiosus]|uniref:hypothetical protein n=1 Tax=Metabacillus fastidiosus TaxID=1458 RepID=UPI003D2B048C
MSNKRFLLLFTLAILLSFLTIKYNEQNKTFQAAGVNLEGYNMIEYNVIEINGSKIIAKSVNGKTGLTFNKDKLEVSDRIYVGSRIKVYMEEEGQLQAIKYVEVVR